jgi:oxidase EvaA
MTVAVPLNVEHSARVEASQWLDMHRARCIMRVRDIPFRDSAEWIFDGHEIKHRCGGFFSVVGARMIDAGTGGAIIEQPLINQPEIGILGFALRRRCNDVEVLVQAKAEPGNVFMVQAAPTVQATESNYLCRHRGKKTKFLERFRDASAARVIADSLQSEQGTRFLCKYNRNMMVEVAGDWGESECEPFAWFALRDVLDLLNRDIQINTDARSVLASCDWRDLTPDRRPFERWRHTGGFKEELLQSYEAAPRQSAFSTAALLKRLAGLRQQHNVQTQLIGLNSLEKWVLGDAAVQSAHESAFQVRQFAIEAAPREVSSWDQPLIVAPEQAEVVLLCQRFNGILHFLFQARSEIGFREGVQLGPTMQFTPGDSSIVGDLSLDQRLLHGAERSRTILSCLHSDEGGRFYRCVSRYCVRLLPDDARIPPDQRLMWMTLGQMQQLIRRQGVFTNEARSLISMLLAFL